VQSDCQVFGDAIGDAKRGGEMLTNAVDIPLLLGEAAEFGVTELVEPNQLPP
jgi:hypothetical protein